MEFDENQSHSGGGTGNGTAPSPNDSSGGGGGLPETTEPLQMRKPPRYGECLKNHAVGIGRQAVDGCREFMPAGEFGSLDALRCAACNCHRNFHRKHTATLLPLGYLHHHHAPPPQQRPLALAYRDEPEEMDVDTPNSGGGSGSKKRFRTKFTTEQKEKMQALAEKLEWRIQKEHEDEVAQLCNEYGIRRHVFKVWMHNNKSSLAKKTPTTQSND